MNTKSLITTAVLLACSTSAYTAANSPVVATAAIGEVTVASGDHPTKRTIENGSAIPLRSEVRTGSGSQVMLNLASGVELRLIANSALVVDDIQSSAAGGDSAGFALGDSAIKSILTHHDAEIGRNNATPVTARMELHSGAIFVSAARTDLKIELPHGAVSCDGGLFSITLEPLGYVRVTVAQGFVMLTLPSGREVRVDANSFAKFHPSDSGFALTGPAPIESDPASEHDFASLQGVPVSTPEPVGEGKEVLSSKEVLSPKEILEPVGELQPPAVLAPGGVGLGLSAPFDLAAQPFPTANPSNVSGPVVSPERRVVAP